MLEHLRARPYIYRLDATSFEDMSQTLPADIIFHFAEHVHPFVFAPSGGTSDMLIDESTFEENPGELDDAPFNIFSVEMLGSHYITIPRPNDAIKVSIASILCVEQKPREFIAFAFCQIGFSPKPIVVMSDYFVPIAKALLKRLKTQAIGVEQVRERIKVGTGKGKKTITIRRIVHVRPKSEAKAIMEASISRHIDWSHRWTVRGHWRELPNGLGKDREGNYTVSGFTWVTDHVKGPEEAPLVTKTRLVLSEKGNE